MYLRPSSFIAQSLQYNLEKFSDISTESINYGDTVFSSSFNIDHSTLLIQKS